MISDNLICDLGGCSGAFYPELYAQEKTEAEKKVKMEKMIQNNLPHYMKLTSKKNSTL
mgnify:CR=1 FL=1